jgi:flagellar FliJ protein
MKRFTWRLQRVLDIRVKEEQKKTSELLEITDKLVAVRSELFIKKKLLENIINGLTAENPKKRLSKQEFFLTHSYKSNEQLKNLKEKILNLEKRQKDKIMEILKVRRSKEGLERLRNEAKIQHIKEQEKLAQKELDDGATILFVRGPQF